LKLIYLTILLLVAAVSAESYNKKHTITAMPYLVNSTIINSPSINKSIDIRYSFLTDSTGNKEYGGYIDTDLDNDHAAGFTYRKYPFSSGDHFFWGTRLGYRYNYYTSTLDSTVLYPQYFNTKTTTNYLQTGAELGWRWNWQWGLTIEASLTINLDCGISNGDKEKNDISFEQTQHQPAIYIGYRF